MTTKEMFHLADDLIRDWMSYTNEPEEYDTQKSITDRLMAYLDMSNNFNDASIERAIGALVDKLHKEK